MPKQRNCGRPRKPFPDRIDASPQEFLDAIFELADEKLQKRPKKPT